MIRYAIRNVTDPKKDVREVARIMSVYMPSNYTATAVETIDGRRGVLIEGEDVAGWTLDGYVLPRLGSGLLLAREIDADEASEYNLFAL